MQTRKNFIVKNEGFTCEACFHVVPPAKKTSRNHCPYCLVSKHVDEKLPGDRASQCGGLMPTIHYQGSDPNKLKLIQKCEKCNKVHNNKVTVDDDVMLLFQLTEHSNTG